MAWEGGEYQARFDALAASGADVHGEATFVRRLQPSTVLDMGCGTGRVAIELARHGIEVVGVDPDLSMIEVARQRAPELEWVAADGTTVELGRRFDVVVMAGNVPLFTPPGANPALLATCARHLVSSGALVCGFSTDRHYSLRQLDADAAAAGLELAQRFSSWDELQWTDEATYAVSIFRDR